ncbi:hypothetical protein M431DRAFT_498746 [Trichoderma harzianum CBS 226.95]|uniref:Major facilitator superfamily (MFS) profile domain-containing protein n=1 Tax=Trichoderma harzianum CBS 226.95 TaxID=983964 RepID=A0A2T4A360_TRIHA|nr:hypothetical protein M431DRAFT_498746 [Trichoderma harzianum CBS 226.95]PTB51500.1 hypothetical protein M431DRAFT_498746 [Trichoderma harzianum CBS 226.95]
MVNETDEDTAPTSPRNVHGLRWALVCISIYVSLMTYGLDMTIAADVQATIIVQFDSVDRLAWVGSGFLLGSVCSIFPVAAFYTAFDYKYLFIVSVSLFEIGTLNYLTALTSNQERGRYMSCIGLVWGVGAILGPVVGGAFSQSSATWRWAFYINLVIAALCAPIYIFFLPSIKPTDSAKVGAIPAISSFDWFGWILSTGAIVCISFALTNGGNIWPWQDYRTIIFCVFSGILIIATAVQQRLHLCTTVEKRLFPPPHIIKNRTITLLNIQTAVTIANIFVPLYFIPLYFQFVHGDSAIDAAVRLLPFVLVFVTISLLSGVFFLGSITSNWVLYAASAIFISVGGGLMYTVHINTASAKIYGYSILLAIGSGLSSQAGYAIAGIKITSKGWPTIDQITSSLLTLLISGQIFQTFAVRNLMFALRDHGFSDADIRGAVAGLQSSLLKNLDPHLAAKAASAVTEAMRPVYILNITYGIICFLASLVMKKERLFAKRQIAMP